MQYSHCWDVQVAYESESIQKCEYEYQNLKGVHSWNKMFSLKSLDILKCESRTSLHVVQYKWQTGSVVMFCIVLILRMTSLEILLCAVWDSFRGLVLFLAYSFFFFFFWLLFFLNSSQKWVQLQKSLEKLFFQHFVFKYWAYWLKSKLTSMTFYTKKIKSKQKWYRSNDYSWK